MFVRRFEEGLRYSQSKSFDKKLYDKGISGKFLKSIKAMHTTVEQRAKINNLILPTITSVLGLKQCDNLSQLNLTSFLMM